MYKSHLMCGTCVRGICMSPTRVGYRHIDASQFLIWQLIMVLICG